MSYQLNPSSHVGERATCGRVQELATCEDCEHKNEKTKAPYIALWAALAVDAELQRSFDYETQAFDSGHEVVAQSNSKYGIWQDGAMIERAMTLTESIQWCIQNREELI